MKFYLGLFILGCGVFLLHYFFTGQAVYGDGIGYYAHLHSWVIDRDWDYTNEYQHNYTPENNNSTKPTSSPSVQIVATRKDGKAENFYGPGVAILLLPFYLFAHLIKNGTGYENIYQVFSGLGAVFYGVLGIYFLEKIIKNKWAVISVFLATQLIYYGTFDVINSHFGSFFLTCLFLYILWKDKLSVKTNLILGLIAGLMFSTRIQDILIVSIWIIELIRQKNINIKYISIFLIGFFLACVPVFYQWQVVFGSIWNHTYLQNLNRDIQQHRPLDLFGSWFNAETGLFSKAPILLIALGTCVVKIKQIKDYRVFILLIFFLLQSLVVTFQRGWPAAAYGGRMYISSLVFFAFLLKYFFEKVKWPKFWGIFFIGLSIFMMGHFILFEKHTQGGDRLLKVRSWFE